MAGMCEMKGFLTFLVLKMISQQHMSGDTIREELKKRKGCKPSPGTIYPVLKLLQKDGLIKEVQGNGKEKLYLITPSGKKELHEATRRFVMLFKDMKHDFEKLS